MTLVPGISSSSLIALHRLDVGIWQWNLPDDLISGDLVLARLVGLDVETVTRGITLGALEARFHPDDLHAVREARQHALDGNGVFVLMHRTIPRPGTVRKLLVRGVFERDAAGQSIGGRGIVVDITDEPGIAPTFEAGWFAAHEADNLPPIDRIAVSVMGARREIIALPEPLRNRLLPHIDDLLGQIGREIATHSVDAAAPRRG